MFSSSTSESHPRTMEDAADNPNYEQDEEQLDSDVGFGSWKHAAFHIATTIATPAAYAPLPFAVASLGWPLGKLITNLIRSYLMLLIKYWNCHIN